MTSSGSVCVLLVCVSFTSAATTIYVSVSGTPATPCGTRAEPCASLARAVSLAREGDTIVLGSGGFIAERVVINITDLTIVGSGMGQTKLNSSSTMLIVSSQNFTMSDIMIYNAASTAIIVTAGSVTFSHCHFYGNKGEQGGAISLISQGVFNFCVFENNLATEAGAALNLPSLEASPFTVVMSDCVFLSNHATRGFQKETYGSQGGAVYGQYGNFSGHNLQFIDNTISPLVSQLAVISKGGAICFFQVSFFCQNCSFTDNGALGTQTSEGFGIGGAIWARSCTLDFTDCVFQRNYAMGSQSGQAGLGGALFMALSTAAITNTTFFANMVFGANSQFGQGGAIASFTCNVTLCAATFGSNVAYGPFNGLGGSGGAYYGQSDNLVARNCSFVSNTGKSSQTGSYGGSGGALTIKSDSAVFEDCSFVDNIAQAESIAAYSSFGGGAGGAAYIDTVGGIVTFCRCLFQDNVAEKGGFGGALHVLASSIVISACVFNGNSVQMTRDGYSGAGGAVFVNQYETVGNTFDVTSSTFFNNSGAGGALYLASTSGTVSATTFRHNYASFVDATNLHGGAIRLQSSSSLTVSQSVFDNNYAIDIVTNYACAQLGANSAAGQVSATQGSTVDFSTDTHFFSDCHLLCSCRQCSMNASCGWSIISANTSTCTAETGRCGRLIDGPNFVPGLTSCCTDRCSGHGTCEWDNLDVVCKCDSFYAGPICSYLSSLAVAVLVSLLLVMVMCAVLFGLWRIHGRYSLKESENQNKFTDLLVKMSGEVPSSAMIDPYDITVGQELGRGTYGAVYLGRYRGTEVAVKCLSTPYLDEEQLASEARLCATLRHPNICLLMGACVQPGSVMLVSEYCRNGSLWDILHDNDRYKNLPWELRHSLALGVARGLLYLHSANPPIIHRDLKSANVLVDSMFQAKVTDFGLTTQQVMDNPAPRSKRNSSLQSLGSLYNRSMSSHELVNMAESLIKEEHFEAPKEVLMTSNIGTLQWCAPETMVDNLADRVKYDTSADIYSFGIVLWEIASRQAPFGHLQFRFQIMDAVQAGQRPPLPEDAPMAWLELIEQCWTQNPDQRPSADQVVAALETMVIEPGFST